MIPKAYCINLDRKPENYKKVCSEFKGILDITRVPAIDGKELGITGARALYDTSIKLFEQSIKTDDQYLIVIEDDIYKRPKFSTYWPKIVNFITTTKTGWDFIALDFFLCLDNPKMGHYNSFLYKVTKFRSCGFMIYNMNFLKKNLNSFKNIFPLDLTITYNQNYIKLIPKELIVRQHVNKVSETCDANTSPYETLYTLTINKLTKYNKGIRYLWN